MNDTDPTNPNSDAFDWARWSWIVGSLLVNVTIAMYIWLSLHAPAEFAERHLYVNANWSAYSVHWKAEFVFMALIAVGALSFAIRTRAGGWCFVAAGQLLLLTIYPVMLGGYRDTPLDVAAAVNEISLVIFLFSNLLFLGGMALVYLRAYEIGPVLRGVALAIALLSWLAFLACFLGLIGWAQAMLAGPLVMILYLINAWYGYRLSDETVPRVTL
jgi:hypothetical protein